jgi:hypothetical protein
MQIGPGVQLAFGSHGYHGCICPICIWHRNRPARDWHLHLNPLLL